VNAAGIAFYNRLIDTLTAHGITPWVTLYHWDLPASLQTELDGWLNPVLVDHFAAYAKTCFENFGDRVKHWITFNEPWVVSIMGYGQGGFAPGRVSNSEPYQVAHQLLRAHAKTVQVFRAIVGLGGRSGRRATRIGVLPRVVCRPHLLGRLSGEYARAARGSAARIYGRREGGSTGVF
jgi:beta-glucosidase/6-phospho-beta-glucosidase/beta-galactosidase